MARLLITGATGFLGSALVNRWAAGNEVHALVRSSSRLDRIAGVRDRLNLHVADSPAQAAVAVQAALPDAIVHTACSYGRAGESTYQLFEANVSLGLALINAVVEGGRQVSFINTGTALDPGVSLYAFSKDQFSAWGRRLASEHAARLRFVDLRVQHMYGPGDDASKFATRVIRSCLGSEAELSLTAGEQQRDFIHVDDVVRAYDIVLSRIGELPASDAMDVGSGQAPTIRELVETIRNLTRASTVLKFGVIPYRANEVMRSVADTGRLVALGWRPTHNLLSGLTDTIHKESRS